jgi:3-oxoacyl-[acyl-carrier protein] reductase
MTEATPHLIERLVPESFAFERLAVGQTAALHYTVGEDHVAAFARLTGDFSPLHVDEQYARRTRHRASIAHGLLVASPVSTLVGMLLPGRYATLMGLEVSFSAPVRIGDRLRLRGEIKVKSAATRGLVIGFEITHAESGRPVARGKAQVLVEFPPRKGRTMSELRDLKLAMSFDNRVALITGASRGIGETTARLFALHGARVALTYFKGKEDAEAIAADIQSNGGTALALAVDVRDPAQVSAAVAKVAEAFGRLDILVNNAAGDYRALPFAGTRWEDVQEDIDIVVKGAHHCIQAALPHLEKQSGATIINVCTAAVGDPVAQHYKYIAAKAALLGLTRALAVELGPRKIRVNAVSPGLTETDLTAGIPEAVKAGEAKRVPLGRLGDPLDAAKAILLLASPYAGYINGEELKVAGGG